MLSQNEMDGIYHRNGMKSLEDNNIETGLGTGHSWLKP